MDMLKKFVENTFWEKKCTFSDSAVMVTLLVDILWYWSFEVAINSWYVYSIRRRRTEVECLSLISASVSDAFLSSYYDAAFQAVWLKWTWLRVRLNTQIFRVHWPVFLRTYITIIDFLPFHSLSSFSSLSFWVLYYNFHTCIIYAYYSWYITLMHVQISH